MQPAILKQTLFLSTHLPPLLTESNNNKTRTTTTIMAARAAGLVNSLKAGVSGWCLCVCLCASEVVTVSVHVCLCEGARVGGRLLTCQAMLFFFFFFRLLRLGVDVADLFVMAQPAIKEYGALAVRELGPPGPAHIPQIKQGQPSESDNVRTHACVCPIPLPAHVHVPACRCFGTHAHWFLWGQTLTLFFLLSCPLQTCLGL